MKYFLSFLIIAFLLSGSVDTYAQDLTKTLAPQAPTEAASPVRAEAPTLQLAPNLLPAKQVTLLYEVTDMEEEDMVDNPDDPEAEFQEHKLAEQTFDLNILLHLFSTANIGAIHAKVGSQLGAADHAQYRFVFNGKEGMSAPFTFVRDGKTVVLGMGQVKGLTPYYVEVVIEGLDGKLSEPRYYNPE